MDSLRLGAHQRASSFEALRGQGHCFLQILEEILDVFDMTCGEWIILDWLSVSQ